jgi:hypothetical protein
MTYYVGNEYNLSDLLGQDNPRYFYGLARTDGGINDGTLYFYKIDQLSSTASIMLNVPGPSANNYETFEYGVDFFDGRLATDHSRPYPNLAFDQYRWDNKNCYYYIDSSGELVVRINQVYPYSQSQIISAN